MVAAECNLRVNQDIQLNFQNRFAQLGESFFTRLAPTGFSNPKLVHANDSAADLINLAEVDPSYFCGNKLIPGGDSLASVYSGHQFGHYVPQLGDGRAIMIGEAEGWEIQLKGSGKTPYSRFGDGRAVLRSCIREYLCSEAMHNLGIPTTRALCIIGSDEDVQRETVEKAAMMTRLSPSHIRFGHFEYFYYTGQHKQLRELADFTINNYYPNANYDEFFEQVVVKTAQLIALWQSVGFCHGVMNTDNMSILGLTIDYGPFGFMEEYNPKYICNHSDHSGRYAYDQQPYIGLWNLHALAQALTPLVNNERAGEILQKYQPVFSEEYTGLMWNKLGFEERQDPKLMGQILDMLEASKVDYTNFFRKLSEGENLRDHFLNRDDYDAWTHEYLARKPNRLLMIKSNPKYILRNYLAENAIQAGSKDDYSEIDKLLGILQMPYSEQPNNDIYAANSPDWAKNLEVSCSS